MTRPVKCRKVDFNPETRYFKPAGIPVRELEEVVISLDELEALRLADYEGLYQEEAAQRMNISRQTFGNIISSARKKTADALTNGKAVKIEGGIVHLADRIFYCKDCCKEWPVPYGTERPETCPSCNSASVQRKHSSHECK